MSIGLYHGRIVALTLCPAHRPSTGSITAISGLYELIDHEPSEWCHYQQPFWYVYSLDTKEEFMVDSDHLWEQVDPQSYGATIAEERMMT